MPTAEARIETERAERYLQQLCGHADRMRRLPGHRPRKHADGERPPAVRSSEWSEGAGLMVFEGGQISVRADSQALTLCVDADTNDDLRRLQTMLTHRLQTIGRRDQLPLAWPSLPVDAVPAPPSTSAHQPVAGPGQSRGHRSLTLVAAGVALLVAAHLVLGDAVLTGAQGTGWTAGIIAAIVLVKVTAIIVGHHRTVRHRPNRRRAGRTN